MPASPSNPRRIFLSADIWAATPFTVLSNHGGPPTGSHKACRSQSFHPNTRRDSDFFGLSVTMPGKCGAVIVAVDSRRGRVLAVLLQSQGRGCCGFRISQRLERAKLPPKEGPVHVRHYVHWQLRGFQGRSVVMIHVRIPIRHKKILPRAAKIGHKENSTCNLRNHTGSLP